MSIGIGTGSKREDTLDVNAIKRLLIPVRTRQDFQQWELKTATGLLLSLLFSTHTQPVDIAPDNDIDNYSSDDMGSSIRQGLL